MQWGLPTHRFEKRKNRCLLKEEQNTIGSTSCCSAVTCDTTAVSASTNDSPMACRHTQHTHMLLVRVLVGGEKQLRVHLTLCGNRDRMHTSSLLSTFQPLNAKCITAAFFAPPHQASSHLSRALEQPHVQKALRVLDRPKMTHALVSHDIDHLRKTSHMACEQDQQDRRGRR